MIIVTVIQTSSEQTCYEAAALPAATLDLRAPQLSAELAQLWHKGGNKKMKTNIQVQRDVLDELEYEPSVDPAEIGCPTVLQHERQ